MKFQEIRDMAKGMGIKKYNNMKKVDLILAIQKAENNMDCYGPKGKQLPGGNMFVEKWLPSPE